jgi:SAM-dependent methyltransferase
VTLRDAWEAEARNWIAWATTPGHDSYWKFHRDVFLPSLPPAPSRVVDVGCGEGRLPRDLKRLGYDVVGVDGSPTLIAAAREADPEGRYEVADAASLPLADASADLVTAFMSLHDIDDIDGALREIVRVLVPGGRLRSAIVHPINSAGRFSTREPDARFEIRGSYFEERRSNDAFERDGLMITFASMHRSLERVASAMLDAGLLIDHVVEVPDWSDPEGSPWRRLPLFLHLGALNPPLTDVAARPHDPPVTRPRSSMAMPGRSIRRRG